jgi:hypothetical protein
MLTLILLSQVLVENPWYGTDCHMPGPASGLGSTLVCSSIGTSSICVAVGISRRFERHLSK